MIQLSSIRLEGPRWVPKTVVSGDASSTWKGFFMTIADYRPINLKAFVLEEQCQVWLLNCYSKEKFPLAAGWSEMSSAYWVALNQPHNCTTQAEASLQASPGEMLFLLTERVNHHSWYTLQGISVLVISVGDVFNLYAKVFFLVFKTSIKRKC